MYVQLLLIRKSWKKQSVKPAVCCGVTGVLYEVYTQSSIKIHQRKNINIKNVADEDGSLTVVTMVRERDGHSDRHASLLAVVAIHHVQLDVISDCKS